MKLLPSSRPSPKVQQALGSVAAVEETPSQRALPAKSAGLDARARNALDSILRTQSEIVAKAWTDRHLAVEEIRSVVVPLDPADEIAKFYQLQYVGPLLELLRGAVAGDRLLSAVYLDERLRYLVPDNIQAAAHEAVLERVLQADAADLAARVPLDSRDAVASFLTDLHDRLKPKSHKDTVRILLIGDCLMTEVRVFLIDRCRELGADVRVRHQYFSSERGVGLNVAGVAEHVSSGAADLVALSFFTYEGLPLYRALLADAGRLSKAEKHEKVEALLRIVRQATASLRKSSDVPILLHNACGLPLNKWRRRIPIGPPIGRAQREVLEMLNHGLAELANGTENVVLIDEVAVVKGGKLREASRDFFSRAVRKRAQFHTRAFGPMLAEAYAPVISAYARLRRVKVLLVDFDNTLWAGVMADGDVAHNARAQRILRQVREAGILLVALSKNDPQSIRWDEMVLKQDDFVLHKISWNQKTQSVGEAAQQLNLGLDSFAVIDDNPAERALIADRFPQVALLDPGEPDTWSAIEFMLSFPNTRQTEESAARTALYREAALRREALVAELDYPEMMASLGLRASWSPAREKDLSRVHELLARTNQFNTTTKRRSLAELRELTKSPQHRVFVFTLGDRFGDLGVVGVVILECAGEALVFDSVVMSCRAMGFGLESLLVRAPLDHMLAAGGRRSDARGLFVPTERNEPSAGLFSQCGFVLDGDGQWLLRSGDALPEVPEWLSVSAQ